MFPMLVSKAIVNNRDLFCLRSGFPSGDGIHVGEDW